jgi:hypothetical protein
MQYVVVNQKQIWENEIVRARLVTRIPPHEEHEWWRVWSGDETFLEAPNLTFNVPANGPFPDSYWFSSVLRLFSDRLVDLLREFDTKFQCFPIKLVDRDSGRDIPLSYCAFRLLATRQCIDYRYSIIEEGRAPKIRKLVLSSGCQQSTEPLFRLERFKYFMIVGPVLKAALERAKITGFEYIPVDEFHDP